MAQEVLLSALLLESFSSYQPSTGTWKQSSGLMTTNLFFTLSTAQSRLVVLQCDRVVASFPILPQLTLVSLCPQSWLVSNPQHCETCLLRFDRAEAAEFGELFVKCQKAAEGISEMLVGLFGSRAVPVVVEEEEALPGEWECAVCYCGNDVAEVRCVACVWPRAKALPKTGGTLLRVKSPRRTASPRARSLTSAAPAVVAADADAAPKPVFAFTAEALETLTASVGKRLSQDAFKFGEVASGRAPTPPQPAKGRRNKSRT